VTSARAALLLRRHGIIRVRPLLGGLERWRELRFPLQDRAAPAPDSR
jgi:3-mercaptopyruvate sulfurtransferase SseA